MKNGLVALLVVLMTASMAYAEKNITIGYTFFSSDDVFQNGLKDMFVKAAKEKGVDVRVFDPAMNIDKQNDAIKAFIESGVKAIVCNPLDYKGSIPGVEAANKAGIPYVAVNTKVGGGDFVYVGSRNYDSGIIEGEHMAKVLPKNANIVYLSGTEGLNHTIDRRKGIQDALLDKRSDVKLLAEKTANYDRTEGLKVMQDWIQAFPKIDGVIAANDQMALGALEALTGAGIKGVLIAGIDGTTEAKQNVKNDTFAITVLQDAEAQASTALQAALDLIEGKKLDKEIIIPFKPITKENVDKYLN